MRSKFPICAKKRSIMVFRHPMAGRPFHGRLLLLLATIPLLRSNFVSQAAGRPRAAVRKSACAASGGTFEENREALKACLAREYRSFFRPFEADFYDEDVSFTDPLNQLKGQASYKANVEMLSGNSLIGNILFSDAFIDLHSVEEVPGEATRLHTRWTLGFAFKLLPWKPRALFSGVSEYTIDERNAKVLTQRDYWDTLSLEKEGEYVPEVPLSGLKDLVSQLLPDPLKPLEAQEPRVAEDAGWALLRRANVYRVYRDQSGDVFALAAPGYRGGLAGIRQEMKLHGLTAGDVVQKGTLEGLQLLKPHPWSQSLEPDAERSDAAERSMAVR